jgi:hypothetical protein
MTRRLFQCAWAIAEIKWLNIHYCDSALTLRKRQCSHEGRIFLDLIGSGRQWSPQNRGPRPLEELPCPARRQPAAALTERSPSPVLHPLGLVDRNAAVTPSRPRQTALELVARPRDTTPIACRNCGACGQDAVRRLCRGRVR